MSWKGRLATGALVALVVASASILARTSGAGFGRWLCLVLCQMLQALQRSILRLWL